MRSGRATHNQIAVSANQSETGLNEYQALDTTLLVSLSDILSVDPRRESNADELTGKEEPDTMYDNGQLAAGSFNFDKAQPQHFAFLASYGLGQCVSTAAGTGKLHTITPIDRDLDLNRSNPSFTAGQRYGDTVLKRLFASMFVDSFTFTFQEDSWCKASGSLKGTGKVEETVIEETVNAAKNATTLALAANGVHGSTAQERLDSIHRVRVELAPGEWHEVDVTGVSAATPAELTITAPDAAADLVNYKVLYAFTEPAWCSFPSRVVESPLRVAQMTAHIGGKYDGTAFKGGRELSSELKLVEWSMSNNMQIKFAPGAGGAYASKAFRDGRSQTLKLDRDFRDAILQMGMQTNEYFSIHILAEGAEFDTGHKYQVEVILPKIGIKNTSASVDGKLLSESTEFIVLQDAAHGSAIVKIKNLVAGYAA
ncbi:hypothetical protein [uncultured Pseudodesulfovibrio sp.]|uniref:hypothetical protein n=1 Tax=uncultured Pseudodesulfovibrio sp. TaxID=2035858 RepID=UPI0029C7CB75|nr:hypothetical protein [uncultured Pseudodesulfovibrio sp.]